MASRALPRPIVVCLALAFGSWVSASSLHAQEAAASPADAISTAPADVPPRPAPTSSDRLIFGSLYGSFIGLQALDLHSTHVALGAGGHEANPAWHALGGAGLSIAMKAATTGTIIYLTEKMRKRRRAAAIVTMIALDSAYTVVVAHNYAIAHR